MKEKRIQLFLWIFIVIVFISVGCFAQTYKDHRGIIRMLYDGDTLSMLFSGDTNNFESNLDFYKMSGAIIIDSLKMAGSDVWINSFVNPSSSVDLSTAPVNSILIEDHDTIGWYAGLVATDGKIYSIGITSASITGNSISTSIDTNWIINSNAIGANYLYASGVGGANVLNAKYRNEFWVNDTMRAWINEGGIFGNDLSVNGNKIDSIYNTSDTLMVVTDSGIFKIGKILYTGSWNRDSTDTYLYDSSYARYESEITGTIYMRDSNDSLYFGDVTGEYSLSDISLLDYSWSSDEWVTSLRGDTLYADADMIYDIDGYGSQPVLNVRALKTDYFLPRSSTKIQLISGDFQLLGDDGNITIGGATPSGAKLVVESYDSVGYYNYFTVLKDSTVIGDADYGDYPSIFHGSIEVEERTILTPSNIWTLVAGTGITESMLSGDMRYNFGTAIDITASPQIVDGEDGEIIKITGLSDTYTLTLDDGDGLQLAGAASMVLGIGDVIQLHYVLSLDLWIEDYRSNN